jgi:hypothetical protein
MVKYTSDNFTHLQVKNAMRRLKEQIAPTGAKLQAAKEKMDITNELLPSYGK